MTGSVRRMVPVFGGLTAAATVVGAVAPAVAQVGEAVPEGTDASSGELGLAQDGTFELCSAYFGFGKENGVGNVTGFEVTDVSGPDDGTAHAVPDDVQVVLVLENEEGEVIECTPEAITEEEWDAEMDLEWNWIDAPAFPDHPVYAYPSYTEGSDPAKPFIDGFGEPVAVGFRVVGVPGDHTLMTPEGVHALPDHFADLAVLFEPETPPSVLAYLDSSVSPAAASAYDAARQACDSGDPVDFADPDLLAAVNALRELVGQPGDLTEVDCSDILFVAIDPVLVLGLLATVAHVEPITLAVAAQATTTTTLPTPPPAAAPVVAEPSFTG